VGRGVTFAVVGKIHMTVRRLLKGKGSFVPVIRSVLTLNDVVDQLDIDDVGALVVTDDKRKILGIITERDIARGLKSHGRDVVDKPLLELMTRMSLALILASRCRRSLS
jgi:CBS domain-containing protein